MHCTVWHGMNPFQNRCLKRIYITRDSISISHYYKICTVPIYIYSLVSRRKQKRDQSRRRYEGEREQWHAQLRINAAKIRRDLYHAEWQRRKRDQKRISVIRDLKEKTGMGGDGSEVDEANMIRMRMKTMEIGMIMPSSCEEGNLYSQSLSGSLSDISYSSF